eukprot:TRINITY_DN6341_c0_g1_i1.p1 TRINITY_DN6341_c0_g1~~TRINITY_DN6341_c0_g1_i1.p1  ORF type:complete len:240 (-),score=29.88 TRINITY_DN6341_c0_g1_i1:11-730(-)
MMKRSLASSSSLILGRGLGSFFPAVQAKNLLVAAPEGVQQTQIFQRDFSLLGKLRPGDTSRWTSQVGSGQLLFKRWMSDKQPRKGFEKFYPKDKESRPVEITNEPDNNKKGKESEDDQNKPHEQQQNPYTGFNNPLFGLGLVLTFMLYQASLNVQVTRMQEIDFQTFRNELLAKDMVEKNRHHQQFTSPRIPSTRQINGQLTPILFQRRKPRIVRTQIGRRSKRARILTASFHPRSLQQ